MGRNLLKWSEQFDNAVWTKTRGSVTTNAATAPDGTLSAELYVPTTENNTHVIASAAVAASPSTKYGWSIHVKAQGYSQLRLRASDSASFLLDTVIDASTGQIIAGSVAPIASIVPMSDGWYRMLLSATTGAAATSIGYQLWVYSGGSGTFAGNGSAGIYICGAQLNQGSPSFYQKTEADLWPAWPAALPDPTVENYALKPLYAGTRTEMESGPARTRRRFTQTPTTLPVQWVLTRDELATFEAWFQLEINWGADSFAVPLINGYSFMAQRAKFKVPNYGEPYTATPQGNGAVWLVKAELEVDSMPVMSAATLASRL